MGFVSVSVLIVVSTLVVLASWGELVGGMGANWGTQASHPLPPETVVRLMKENGIQKVKLFDADYGALRALSKSGIEVMVGIPNDMLATLATNMKAAEKWVSKNVSAHISNNNVNIRSPSLLTTSFKIIFQFLVPIVFFSPYFLAVLFGNIGIIVAFLFRVCNLD